MLSDRKSISSQFGIPDSGLEKQTSTLSLLEFIENYLDAFRVEYKHLKPEKGLTSRLVQNLNRQANLQKCLWFFHHENPENHERGDSTSNDFAVYFHSESSYTINNIEYDKDDPFFVFESKILGISEKYREKEYLKGYIIDGKYKICGGIERYKQEKHGEMLYSAGMIGFVKRHSFIDWLNSLNLWINELAIEEIDNWTSSDLLTLLKNNKTVASLSSNHSRINLNSISLYHLWVDLQ